MRSYYIDELQKGDMQLLLPYLEAKGLQGSLAGVYWLFLPEHLLTGEQRAHRQECGPFVASLEIGDTWLKAEMLIRGRGRLRCSCIAYATPEQRDWLVAQVDAMLRDLNIAV
ncbi:MAG TPA: hypothetical protein ENN39_12365 [Desulfonatronum sp.]|nr:hypothetical protein [Desulfonatronum sp.]